MSGSRNTKGEPCFICTEEIIIVPRITPDLSSSSSVPTFHSQQQSPERQKSVIPLLCQLLKLSPIEKLHQRNSSHHGSHPSFAPASICANCADSIVGPLKEKLYSIKLLEEQVELLRIQIIGKLRSSYFIKNCRDEGLEKRDVWSHHHAVIGRAMAQLASATRVRLDRIPPATLKRLLRRRAKYKEDGKLTREQVGRRRRKPNSSKLVATEKVPEMTEDLLTKVKQEPQDVTDAEVVCEIQESSSAVATEFSAREGHEPDRGDSNNPVGSPEWEPNEASDSIVSMEKLLALTDEPPKTLTKDGKPPRIQKKYKSKYKPLRLYRVKCDRCGEELENRKKLNIHLSEVHNFDPESVCRYCNVDLSTSYQPPPDPSSSSSASDLPYECTFDSCKKKRFRTLRELRVHHHPLCRSNPFYVRRNMPESRTCATCGATFSLLQNLRYHVASQHEKKFKVFCEICGKGHQTLSMLQVHIRITHGEPRHECETCGKKYKTKKMVREHVRTHTGEKPYVCEQCGKGFHTSTLLKDHQNNMHSNQQYPCPLCGKFFKSNKYVKMHCVNFHRKGYTFLQQFRPGTSEAESDTPVEPEKETKAAC